MFGHLLSYEVEGRFPDAVVDVSSAVHDGLERNPWRADAVDDCASHESGRIKLQMTKIAANDGAVAIKRVL